MDKPIGVKGKVYSPLESPKGQLTGKELQAYLGMSWNSILKYLFHLDGFPKKNRKQVVFS